MNQTIWTHHDKACRFITQIQSCENAHPRAMGQLCPHASRHLQKNQQTPNVTTLPIIKSNIQTLLSQELT